MAIHLPQHGPPVERLPFTPKLKGEQDIAERFPDAFTCVVPTLLRWPTADEVRAHLPDYIPEA